MHCLLFMQIFYIKYMAVIVAYKNWLMIFNSRLALEINQKNSQINGFQEEIRNSVTRPLKKVLHGKSVITQLIN
jgi:hypothetical protein